MSQADDSMRHNAFWQGLRGMKPQQLLREMRPSEAAPVEQRALLEVEVIQRVILVRQLMHIAPGPSAIGVRRRPAA